MFGRTPKDKDREAIEPVMNAILVEMAEHGPNAPEYPALMKHLEQIVALRASKDKPTFTPDGVLMVAGNLLGILVIVAYEQKHVMVSAAKNFILKSK